MSAAAAVGTPPRSAVQALLSPRSVALVGASPRAGSLAERPLQNLRRHGFTGRILPVNPRYEEVGGLRCYPNLSALPEAPDVVLTLTGVDHVFATLDEAVGIGARAAVLFAGGFAETGAEGAALQRRLTEYGRRGLRICGPNTNGLFNVAEGVALGFSAGFEQPARRGRIALISQSGAIATGVSSRAMQNGHGFSHVVATGNEADLEVSDFVAALVDDPGVETFAIYVEGLKDPARFLAAAERALEAGKPITLLKAGRFAAGHKVALSHTGALAGSYEVLAGALRQRGVQLVEEVDDLVGLASLFTTGVRATGRGAGVLSLSGGMAALVADACEAESAPLAAFGPATEAALAEALPAMASLANPLDVTGQAVNAPHVWTRCLEAVSADPAVDAVVSVLSITANATERRFADDILAARASGPMQLCVWTSGAPDGCGAERLREGGVPVFLRATDAVSALAAWRRYWTTREARRAALAQGAQGGASIRPLPAPTDGWALLAAAGVPRARQALVSERTRLAPALDGFRYPLVVKIESAGIPHRTELGLVRLGVRTLAEAEAAFDDILALAAERAPAAEVDGVLVQEMLTGRRELILGVRREPGLPPAVVIGAGGVFTEAMADIAIRLAPVTPFDVAEMVDELRMSALFGPIRGLGAVDMSMFAELVGRVSHLALACAGEIAEFEINPLIVADDGGSAAAVDVLAHRVEGAQP